MLTDDLKLEAAAFDKQILDRVKNGHIPDLRRAGRCEYFYNNVWRDQYFANLYFGELVLKIVKSVKKYFKNKKLSQLRLLEVGCGPGHMCLELARNGLNVVGLDISKACIDIAVKTANEDPYKKGRGSLEYVRNNFLEYKEKFDIILFTASLHHFPKTKNIIKHAHRILNSNGIIIADEPTRDQVSKKNVALIFFLKGLLSASGSYFDNINISIKNNNIKKQVEKMFREERYETKSGSKVQSVNDNEAGLKDMFDALTKYFNQLEFYKDFALYHQLIGGLRLSSVEKEHKLALFIKQMDSLLCTLGAIDSTNFYFIGRKKK